MRLILMTKPTQKMKLGVIAASLLLGLPVQRVDADDVPITNSSFESPDAAGSWAPGVPSSWVGSSGIGNAFVESSASVGFTGGDGAQYAGLDSSGDYIYQDLGVAFAANTTYTIDLAGAHRSGFSHGTVEFGLFSSDTLGTDVGTPGFLDLQGVWTGSGNPDGDDMFNVLRDASALQTLGTGALGGVYSYTTGGSAPTGNVAVFIRNATGNRINFDNVRLDATAIPEPATLVLLTGCCMALAAGRKRTQ